MKYFHFLHFLIFQLTQKDLFERAPHFAPISMSLKWERNGELAHKDLSELIERLKNVESEHTSSELSRLSTKSNIKD